MHTPRRELRSRRTSAFRGGSLFQRALALAADRPVFTASFYAVDGITGKVASFIDWNDPTHTLSQATSAKQVAIPATHADFAGQLCATFAGGQDYVSNRSATAHDYLQNGPVDFASIFTPTLAGATQLIWGNSLLSGTFQSGALFYVDDGGPLRHFLTRTGGTALREVAITTNTPYYAYGYVDASASPQHSLKRSGLAADTGALAGTDAAGTSALRFGADNTDARFLTARVAVLLHFAPILTAAQRNTRAAWAATYGVAA